MVIKGDFTTGGLIATVLLSGRLMQPIQKALFLWTQFQEYRLANDTANSIFSIDQIQRHKEETNYQSIGTVELQNVSFSYGEKLIFSNINLSLQIPDIIAIHGANDAGKSTLLKLIAGILEPSVGSIIVDGIQVSRLASEDLVYHVGLIADESIMFQGTIMENLTAFDNSKEDRALELADLLKVDREIALLPHGYETKVSDGFADTIAPGIKQRIAIIRVLLNKPKVILFNNADKGLDREGYNHLIRLLTMLKGKVTMIVSTDDQNISKLADRHYLLKDGSLSEVEAENAAIFEIKPYKELKI